MIENYRDCVLLDIGCGFNYKLLETLSPYISHGFGIDFKVKEVKNLNITTINAKLDDKLPFEDNKFDIITMLAVLEHLDKPLKIIKEIERVLKYSGKLILTVPSKLSKPVLEFLSFKLKIISELEIRDHKKYYNYKDLKQLFSETNFKIEHHKYFQMGMNNFCVVKL